MKDDELKMRLLPLEIINDENLNDFSILNLNVFNENDKENVVIEHFGSHMENKCIHMRVFLLEVFLFEVDLYKEL